MKKIYSILKKRGKVSVGLGLTYGDEGKGNVITNLLQLHKYAANARWQGGPNAGHTLVLPNGETFATHMIPSGAIIEGTILLMGNCMVIDPVKLKKEYLGLKEKGFDVKDRLFISEHASLISPYHKIFDLAEEFIAKEKIGTTASGIGPAYADRVSRKFPRIGNICDWASFKDEVVQANLRHEMMIGGFLFKGFTFDQDKLELDFIEWMDALEWISVTLNITKCFQEKVEDILASGQNILGEGAQGSALDLTFGDVPYVTSSNTNVSGIFEGLSIGSDDIGEIYAIFKPYTTKVGGGRFVSRMTPEYEDAFQVEGKEIGATTGRKRGCGFPDFPLLLRGIMLNLGFSNGKKIKLIITKTDCFPKKLHKKKIPVVTEYEYENGRKTNHIEFPLKNVVRVITGEEASCWQTPEGLTTWDGHKCEGLMFYLNILTNQLKEVIEECEIYMVTTGPKTGQYFLYNA